ncbi:MAG: helix-turn-helix domain-containing protein [Burkholderiaceae bacterium]
MPKLKKIPIGITLDAPSALSVVRSVAEIGDLIAATRRAQGLTQGDVAGLAGLGNRFLVDLEHGKATIQAQKMLEVLALLGLELVVRKKG